MNQDLPNLMGNTTLILAAISYARSGIPVFPCNNNKEPCTEHGFKDATTNVGVVTKWWTQWPEALIGMPTGMLTGIWAFDVDVSQGKCGAESLSELIRQHGQLPDTRTVRTRSGGTHYYFKYVDGIRNSTGYTDGNGPHGIADNLDVRSTGGYVIVPPSTGYSFIDSDETTTIADAPPWLIELAKHGRKKPHSNGTVARNGSVGEGGRNAHLTSLAGVIRNKGYSEKIILAAITAENAEACKPPLGVGEVAAIARSVARYEPAKKTAAQTDEWPPLVSLDEIKLPQIPAAAYPGWLGDMVGAIAAACEVPDELPGLMALSVVSGAAAHRFVVEVEPGYKEPLVIWSLAAYPSGGRKTAVVREVSAPVFAVERKLIKQGLVEVAAWKRRQNEKNKVKKGKQDGDDPDDLSPVIPRLIVQDVTPEHLGTMLSHHHERLICISDEGGIVDSLGGRYNKDGAGPNLDLINQSHSMGAVRVDRGSRDPVLLDRPRVSVAVTPQPRVLASIKNRGAFRNSGLLARFAYALPPSRLGYRTGNGVPIPEDVRRAYSDGVTGLLNAPHVAQDAPLLVLRQSRDSHAVWKAFWGDVETMMQPGGVLGDMTDWAGKLPGLTARIAGVFHLVSYGPDAREVLIEAATMERAVALSRLLIPHAVSAFENMHRDHVLEAALAIKREVAEYPGEAVKVADVHRILKNRYPHAKDLEPGWQMLIDRGYVRYLKEDTTNKRGRPSLAVEVRDGI